MLSEPSVGFAQREPSPSVMSSELGTSRVVCLGPRALHIPQKGQELCGAGVPRKAGLSAGIHKLSFRALQPLPALTGTILWLLLRSPPAPGWSVEDVPRVPGVCRISSVSVSLLAPAEKSVWNRNELSIME